MVDLISSGGDATVDFHPLITVLQLGNQVGARIAQAIIEGFPAEAAVESYVNITSTGSTGSARVVSSSPGYLCAVSVTAASSNATGAKIYDSNNLATVSSADLCLVIGSCVGYYEYVWPVDTGIVCLPSTSSVIYELSLSFKRS